MHKNKKQRKLDNYISERRKYPRLMIPVYFRASSDFSTRIHVSNISLGGARIYSDERLRIRETLELEFNLPHGQSIKAIARVVWIKKLPSGSEAVYDIGLEFLQLDEDAIKYLKAVLKQ